MLSEQAGDPKSVTVEQPCDSSVGSSTFGRLVVGVQAGQESATEELHRTFHRGLVYFFFRHVGAEYAEEYAQQSIICLIQAIQDNRIQDPNRLTGYCRGIAANILRGAIKERINRRVRECDLGNVQVRDPRGNTEASLLHSERVAIMLSELEKMAAKQREILRRFYLEEQTQTEICQAMGLTDTQFRLLKSRAKAALTMACQKTAKRKPMRGGTGAHDTALTA